MEMLKSVLFTRDSNFLLEKIDTSFVPISSLNEFITLQKNENESIPQFQFAGFKTSDLESNNSPVMVVWVNKINSNKMKRYTFYILNSNEKIIYIGLEEVKNGFVKRHI